MMLASGIKKLLMERGAATINEIASLLKTDPGMVEDVLARWILEGKVTKEENHHECRCCGCGCSSGSGGSRLLYKWKG
jgi:predicted transcriptional regulator